MHDLLIYDYSCLLIFCHLALTTFWNYRSAIASADCFDRYYQLSDYGFSHNRPNPSIDAVTVWAVSLFGNFFIDVRLYVNLFSISGSIVSPLWL